MYAHVKKSTAITRVGMDKTPVTSRPVASLLLLLLAARATRAAPLLCEDLATHGLTARTNTTGCPQRSRAWRGAAVNIFDSFWVASSGMPDTCCNASGGLATRADSVAALRLAAANGVRVFRFFAFLWGPHCAFAVQRPATYWAELDAWWDEVDGLGMYAIPSLGASGWHYAARNETLNDLVKNEHSNSRRFAAGYVRTFVERYSKRKSLLFWELGNELNLHVDLPAPHCDPSQQCFDTQQMVAFQNALVATIRAAEIDPVSQNPFGSRPVSSGFAAPRPSAWHQAHYPPHDARYWDTDNETQWLEMLEMQHAAAVDVWSLHMYDNAQGDRNVSLLSAAVTRARAHGKMLFLGEYGGNQPNYTGPSSASRRFPQLCLDAQVEDAKKGFVGGFALSAVWAFACPSHRKDMVCIWPGQPDGAKENGTQAALAMLTNANKRLLPLT
jgi:hypothetical protein